MLDFEERRGGGRLLRGWKRLRLDAHARVLGAPLARPISPPTRRKRRFSSTLSQQRSRWPGWRGSLASRRGTSTHRSKRWGHRGAKWQPVGGRTSEGGAPAIVG